MTRACSAGQQHPGLIDCTACPALPAQCNRTGFNWCPLEPGENCPVEALGYAPMAPGSCDLRQGRGGMSVIQWAATQACTRTLNSPTFRLCTHVCLRRPCSTGKSRWQQSIESGNGVTVLARGLAIPSVACACACACVSPSCAGTVANYRLLASGSSLAGLR